MVLAGVMLKLGVFGIFRFVILANPAFAALFGPIIVALCVVGALLANYNAYFVADIKKKIALSSIAHMNLCIAAGITSTLAGAVSIALVSLSHGVVSTGLFLVSGAIIARSTSRDPDIGLASLGEGNRLLFAVLLLMNSAFPLSVNFLGELFSFLALLTGGFP
jgi:NADH:ubiquinone oxidoreductase subunit 4 (subunit M)